MERAWRPSEQQVVEQPQQAEQFDHDVEYEPLLDTLLVTLDHILSMAHGTSAYFDEHPEVGAVTVRTEAPETDAARADQYTLTVTPNTVKALNQAAFGVWLDVAYPYVQVGTDEDGRPIYQRMRNEDHAQLANDIVQSWQSPEDVHPVFIDDPNS